MEWLRVPSSYRKSADMYWRWFKAKSYDIHHEGKNPPKLLVLRHMLNCIVVKYTIRHIEEPIHYAKDTEWAFVLVVSEAKSARKWSVFVWHSLMEQRLKFFQRPLLIRAEFSIKINLGPCWNFANYLFWMWFRVQPIVHTIGTPIAAPKICREDSAKNRILKQFECDEH